MLVNFTVANYRSFNKPQSLRMEATSTRELKECILHRDNYKLLPSAVLYGANSSGKSNLIKAIGIMRHVVLQSLKLNPDEEIEGYEPFALSTTTVDAPTRFEIQVLIEKSKFRYGFTYDNERIQMEWLYEKRNKEREYKLFFRAGGDIDYSKNRFPEGEKVEMVSVEQNRLVLSLSAQLSGVVARKVMSWFSHCNIISGLTSDSYGGFSVRMFQEHLPGHEEALAFLQKMELGFEKIEIEESDFNKEMLPDDFLKLIDEQQMKKMMHGKVVSMNTLHHVYNEKGQVVKTLPFKKERMESAGSQKLIEMCGPVFDTLLKGKVLIIDELDAKLHPLLTREIIALFNTKNEYGAQLIFATHDTNLLNAYTFRRDQIWFTEKNPTAETELYSLAEFKMEKGEKVRKDRKYEKDYINGRYGAIPYLK
jgi:AAA15 family ATPase/GTPase